MNLFQLTSHITLFTCDHQIGSKNGNKQKIYQEVSELGIGIENSFTLECILLWYYYVRVLVRNLADVS